jgi:hypothetical protein
MDNSQARAIVDQFLAVYAWQFAYVNRTWWHWIGDKSTWDYVDARHHMRRVFVIIAEDLFPQTQKLVRQVNQDYVFNALAAELRWPLTQGDLPCGPKPGSRHSSEPPAPATRPEPDQPSESAPHPAVPSQELDHPDGTDGSAGHTP